MLSAAKKEKRNRRSTTKFPGAITWKEGGKKNAGSSGIVWRTYITTVAASISLRQSSKLIQVKQRRCVCVCINITRCSNSRRISHFPTGFLVLFFLFLFCRYDRDYLETLGDSVCILLNISKKNTKSLVNVYTFNG